MKYNNIFFVRRFNLGMTLEDLFIVLNKQSLFDLISLPTIVI